MSDSKRIPALMRIPPPLIFVAAFLAGVALQRVAGFTVPAVRGVRVAGIMVVCSAALLAVSCLVTFFTARTTVVPFLQASRLVTWGPYRFTRNPMYLSLVAAYLGVAAVSSQILPVVLLPIPIVFLQRIVIPFEEERLRKSFSKVYDQYRATVRRWL
jgi:protein-S-isoprenylcysteine O-methyltransferase Ste14